MFLRLSMTENSTPPPPPLFHYRKLSSNKVAHGEKSGCAQIDLTDVKINYLNEKTPNSTFLFIRKIDLNSIQKKIWNFSLLDQTVKVFHVTYYVLIARY
jgi:hypothetical protein